MPTLTLNGTAVPFQPGTTILDAARAAGIDIPTLCWYPKLSIVGNCRICLVPVEGEAKLLRACATTVADGMVVTPEPPAAVENRRGVLRLLLERYPGDHLRNGGRAQPRNEFEQYVVRYGVEPTPLAGRDLPVRSGDERPGDPMIRHDMSTCILCTRCVRACADIQVVRVTSPDIELDTPNQGSTCVKGRFGYDFPQHHDRLTKPLIRKDWIKEGGRWIWKGGSGADRRGGPWQTIEGEGQKSKPGTPPRATGKSVRELPLLERLDLDIRDRVATPADWYTPFREATWDEALELTAQEVSRIKRASGPNALACFSSAKCSNEEN